MSLGFKRLKKNAGDSSLLYGLVQVLLTKFFSVSQQGIYNMLYDRVGEWGWDNEHTRFLL